MSYEYALSEAEIAIEDAFNSIEWDFDLKRGWFPGVHKESQSEDLDNVSELIEFLIEKADQAFYASVVFEDGTAVFQSNSYDQVYHFLQGESCILDQLGWKI
jgi:hypothetical protein